MDLPDLSSVLGGVLPVVLGDAELSVKCLEDRMKINGVCSLGISSKDGRLEMLEW